MITFACIAQPLHALACKVTRGVGIGALALVTTIERYKMLSTTDESVAPSPERLLQPPRVAGAAKTSHGPRAPQEAVPGKTPLQNSTAAAYAKDLRLFLAWGGVIPTPVTMLHKYMLALGAKTAPVTIYRRVQAIRHAHVAQGLPSPTHDASMRPILRGLQLGYAPAKHPNASSAAPVRKREPKSAKPITRSVLLRMLDAMHRNSLDRRDRALLLLGFVAALRRAELVAINVSDLGFTTDALIVVLNGRKIAVPATGGPLCAVAATKEWIAHAALDLEQPPGPLFRRFDRGGDPMLNRLGSAWVSVVVKNRLKAVGIDPGPYSAQSLRVGRLLEAAKGTL